MCEYYGKRGGVLRNGVDVALCFKYHVGGRVRGGGARSIGPASTLAADSYWGLGDSVWFEFGALWPLWGSMFGSWVFHLARQGTSLMQIGSF